MRSIVLASALALGACGKQPAARPPAPAYACQLGPPAAAVPARSIAGYPLLLRLAPDALAARTRALEAKVPPWQLALDEDGFPELAVLVIGGPVVQRRDASHERAVSALLSALRDAYGVGPTARPWSYGNGHLGVNTDTAPERRVYISVLQEAGPRGAELRVKADRVIALPADLRERVRRRRPARRHPLHDAAAGRRTPGCVAAAHGRDARGLSLDRQDRAVHGLHAARVGAAVQ
jgi:hypothetical protein